MTNGEVISLDITPCLPALIFQQEPEPGCSKQEEKAGAPEEPVGNQQRSDLTFILEYL